MHLCSQHPGWGWAWSGLDECLLCLLTEQLAIMGFKQGSARSRRQQVAATASF